MEYEDKKTFKKSAYSPFRCIIVTLFLASVAVIIGCLYVLIQMKVSCIPYFL